MAVSGWKQKPMENTWERGVCVVAGAVAHRYLRKHMEEKSNL